jgi:hypothetical protein
MSNEQSAPAEWPTDDMVVRGAEELHDSLRMFGIDINFDTKTKGTEIQQEIVEAVFNAMIAAAPKAEQPPVQDITYWSIQVEKRLCEKLGKPWQASGMSIETLIDELAAAAPAQPQTCPHGVDDGACKACYMAATTPTPRPAGRLT